MQPATRAVFYAWKRPRPPAGVRKVPLYRRSPHQLWHLFVTRVGSRFGIEQARVSGGHASLNATEIYLERDLKKAKTVAREMG